jgi:hypothetical protein
VEADGNHLKALKMMELITGGIQHVLLEKMVGKVKEQIPALVNWTNSKRNLNKE